MIQTKSGTMSQKVWKRKTSVGSGLEQSLAALREPQAPRPFTMPSKNVSLPLKLGTGKMGQIGILM